MIVLSDKLQRRKSQIQRLPLIAFVRALNDDVELSTIDAIEEQLGAADLLGLLCNGVPLEERLKRVKSSAKKIAAKLQELEDKDIDDSNIKQALTGTEKAIYLPAHSINDHLRIIEKNLDKSGHTELAALVSDKVDQLEDDIDDFDPLMNSYARITDENYMLAIGKDLSYADYMFALGRTPAKLDHYSSYLAERVSEAFNNQNCVEAREQGVDEQTTFDMVKNLVKKPVVALLQGVMAAAAIKSFEETQELDQLVGEILPVFADEIFERNDEDGLYGTFCNVYNDLSQK